LPHGVTPGNGFRKLPFVSANLGEEQSLIESDLRGYGRDPLTPGYDVVSNESDIVVPMDHRNIGFWLKALYGNPTGALTISIPASSNAQGPSMRGFRTRARSIKPSPARRARSPSARPSTLAVRCSSPRKACSWLARQPANSGTGRHSNPVRLASRA
jgi:hypothetical protein